MAGVVVHYQGDMSRKLCHGGSYQGEVSDDQNCLAPSGQDSVTVPKTAIHIQVHLREIYFRSSLATTCWLEITG